jgi:hypothetical protein
LTYDKTIMLIAPLPITYDAQQMETVMTTCIVKHTGRVFTVALTIGQIRRNGVKCPKGIHYSSCDLYLENCSEFEGL